MDFGKYIEERGNRWYDHSMFFPDRYKNRLAITYAFVATENHFALNKGGRLFNQHSPQVILPATASHREYLSLLGLLNSSVASFWMKQTFHDKGNGGIGGGIGDEGWERRFEHDSTKLRLFPLVCSRSKTADIADRITNLALERANLIDAVVSRKMVPSRETLDGVRNTEEELRGKMISLQEELDWLCYGLYGLLDPSDQAIGEPEKWVEAPALALGQPL